MVSVVELTEVPDGLYQVSLEVYFLEKTDWITCKVVSYANVNSMMVCFYRFSAVLVKMFLLLFLHFRYMFGSVDFGQAVNIYLILPGIS